MYSDCSYVIYKTKKTGQFIKKCGNDTVGSDIKLQRSFFAITEVHLNQKDQNLKQQMTSADFCQVKQFASIK